MKPRLSALSLTPRTVALTFALTLCALTATAADDPQCPRRVQGRGSAHHARGRTQGGGQPAR